MVLELKFDETRASRSTRKHDSGNKKRQRRKRDEQMVESQRGAIRRFVVKGSNCPEPSGNHDPIQTNDNDNVCDDSGVIFNVVGSDEGGLGQGLEDVIEVVPDLTINDVFENTGKPGLASNGTNENVGEPVDERLVNIYDPTVWDSLATKWKDLLVRNGPVRYLLVGKGPRDGKRRRFSSEFYNRYLPNGEKHHRDWLVYCKDLDKVFCFCCKLFKKKQQFSNLAYDGICDWGHLSQTLKVHERSPEHAYHMTSWFELRVRLESGQAIDGKFQDQMKRETKHWRRVLKRLIAIVKFLSKQSLAFRGSHAKLYDENNGNFMALVEMIAGWDSTLKEHIRRKESHEIHYHYLSPKIQNELILLIAAEIKCGILEKIRKARYFSVILDCTPDVSKQEQMTFLLRCVDVSSDPVKVEEYFLQFLVVNDTTGQGLFDYLKDVLKSLDLDIDDVRGQSYDNGSNMKGKHKGVQRKLLDVNPRAFYTPCASHSLNLTLSDMANSCDRAVKFFGVVQRIYTLFADSTKRWKVLTDKLPKKSFTLKSLSTTRWESRIESVKAIVTQAPQIVEALNQLADEETDARVKSEAACLAEYELGSFEFITGMVIWYQILAKVNNLSKVLQYEKMQIDEALRGVSALIEFFKDYRENGFDEALNGARVIASDLGVDPVFVEKMKGRKIRKKRHFDEIDDDTLESEPLQLSPQESFRIQYFLYLVNEGIGSLERRFEQYKQYEEVFGFLFTSEKLKSMGSNELKAHCHNLEKRLEHGEISDIDGDELFNELELLQKHLPTELTTASAILNFFKKVNTYPVSCLAYRILLTVPITVASAERSFSKLKLLKSYMRSTMSQERLNALALILIENEFLESLNYESMMDDFASKNARRSMFRKK